MLINAKAQSGRGQIVTRAMSATQITRELMAEMVKAAGLRTASLNQHGTVIQQLNNWLAASAWLDAALLLLSIELPGWSLRRLVQEDGVWYCSLSRTQNIPIEFDDTLDASHPDPAIAIMLAVLTRHNEDVVSTSAAEGLPSPDGCMAMCCDNFS